MDQRGISTEVKSDGSLGQIDSHVAFKRPFLQQTNIVQIDHVVFLKSARVEPGADFFQGAEVDFVFLLQFPEAQAFLPVAAGNLQMHQDSRLSMVNRDDLHSRLPLEGRAGVVVVRRPIPKLGGKANDGRIFGIKIKRQVIVILPALEERSIKFEGRPGSALGAGKLERFLPTRSPPARDRRLKKFRRQDKFLLTGLFEIQKGDTPFAKAPAPEFPNHDLVFPDARPKSNVVDQQVGLGSASVGNEGQAFHNQFRE